MAELMKGFMKNAKGGFDPEDMVKDIDKLRDSLVKTIIDKSTNLSNQLAREKAVMFADIRAFTELSAERYGVKWGGKKGNMSFMSYDGAYKIKIAVNDAIHFDEGLHIAKELIDECIKDWSKSSPGEIQALVNDAFYVGKEGKINTERVLGLRRLDIQDERWKRAMDAISDSVQVSESKEYIRCYRRDEKGKYTLINLDVASL